MRVKKLIAENFKGQKILEVDFDGKDAIVMGENGSGKTTIASLFYWLFADTDYELNNNPNIRPDGADDGVVTRGEAIIEIGGKEISFTKIQKVKSKTGNDGKTKTTKTNSFEVNSVPKSQRDAFKYLEELGFNAEKFMPLSHPDVFLKDSSEKNKRAAIRDVLFGMTSAVSDMEVAKQAGLAELAKLLEKYSTEEIVSIQNAAKRKIAQEYGRKGEILDSKIDGLNAAKTEADGEAAEIRKEELLNAIKSTERELSGMSVKTANAELVEQIQALRTKRSEHSDKIAREAQEYNWNVRDGARKLEAAITLTENKIGDVKRNIVDATSAFERLSERIAELQDQYKNTKAKSFDGSKAVCPTCKRRYSPKKVEELARNFETEKAKSLEEIVKAGKEAAEQKKKAGVKKATFESRLEELKQELEAERKALTELPAEKEIKRTDEATAEYDARIAELEAKMVRDDDAKKAELLGKLDAAKKELQAVAAEMANAESNTRIDGQIAELQKKRTDYEQARLDCERILDAAKQLEMAKNEQLTEQINSHFSLVKWKLFDVQANGEILTDRCTPYIDGLSMAECANKGRVILGKLDICDSLQKFYGEEYPIFLDNAESLTENTEDRINVGCQLVTLAATNIPGLEISVKEEG